MTVKDRLMALQLLPEKENFAKLRIVHNARMKLALSEEEIKELGYIERQTILKEDYDKLIADANGNKKAVEQIEKRFIPVETRAQVGKITSGWGQKGNEPKEIDLGLTAISMIKEKLEELDKKKELSMNFLELCEKLKIGEE